MLEVQKYLQDHSLDDLKNELGIEAVIHPDLPLVILNYHMINSPKTNKIVRECRGLVLEQNSWELVSRSFFRFFNWGEVADEMPLFNFNNFHTTTKEDGSLINIFNYKGRWFANTRASFGNSSIHEANITWQEVILKAIDRYSLQDLQLDPNLSYACELCSLHNKVVRKYDRTKMVLLSAFHRLNELPIDALNDIKFFDRPERFHFKSIEQIQGFISSQSKNDPTYEGVVICDDEFRRWKCKNPTYLALHQIRGNETTIHPKHIIPFVLENNTDELLCYFSEFKDEVNNCKDKVESSFNDLLDVWHNSHKIEDQKEFALSIVGKTQFTGILFTLRKQNGSNQTEQMVKDMWHKSHDAILKNLF